LMSAARATASVVVLSSHSSMPTSARCAAKYTRDDPLPSGVNALGLESFGMISRSSVSV